MTSEILNPKTLTRVDPEKAQALIAEWLEETDRMFCPLDPEGYLERFIRTGQLEEERPGVYKPTGKTLE